MFNIGIDVVDIDTLAKKLESSQLFLDKILTTTEQKDGPLSRWAGKIAIKEALIKASYLKVGEWLSVEVLRKPNGQPFVVDSSGQEEKHVTLSITHTPALAIGVVIYEEN